MKHETQLWLAGLVVTIIVPLVFGFYIYCNTIDGYNPVKKVKDNQLLIECNDGSTEWFEIPKCEGD